MVNTNYNGFFKNKRAAISGGATGIGYAIAEMLALEGANTCLISRNEENLIKAVNKIKAKGGQADYRVSDILDVGHIEKIIAEIKPDIFVNNAGDFKEHGLNSSFEEIQKMGQLIFHAPYRIAKDTAEKYNNIDIVTTLSHAAYSPMPGNMSYVPFKAGLMYGLFQIEVELQEEKKKTGIDRNVRLFRVYPGPVNVGNYMELYKKDTAGKFGPPTTAESVATAVLDLLSGKAPTRDVYVAYVPGEGIVNAYFKTKFDPTHLEPYVLSLHSKKIVDPNYKVEK
ncbi:MAG TPA: SDR family oxidoreductase [Alphaproteobacteria bacterium]|nr:SDR family oxidoreductase [Alphaproteobacteria bacterium]